MVIRADPECNWCLITDSRQVAARAIPLSEEGQGGLYDLCAKCEEMLLGPFRLMRERKLVRANRQEDLPDGWYGTAWPGAKSAIDITAFGVESHAPDVKGRKVGKRNRNGGARQNTGPAPTRRDFKCPLLSCDHPGHGSMAGVTLHIQAKHAPLRIRDLMACIRVCGFCGHESATTPLLGVHIREHHSKLLPRSRDGLVLRMISMVRDSGSDPHGALASLQMFTEQYDKSNKEDSTDAIRTRTMQAEAAEEKPTEQDNENTGSADDQPAAEEAATGTEGKSVAAQRRSRKSARGQLELATSGG